MSHFDRFYSNNDGYLSREVLRLEGPTIPLEITVPDIWREEIAKKGIKIQPVKGLAIIDTGASASVVDESVIKMLHMQPLSVKDVITPGGVGQYKSYPAKFLFTEAKLPAIEFNSVLSSDHIRKKQGIIVGRIEFGDR